MTKPSKAPAPKVNKKGAINHSNTRRASRPRNPVEQGQAVYDDITAEVVAHINDDLLPQFFLMVEAVREAMGIKDENGRLPSERLEIAIKNLKSRSGDKAMIEINKPIEPKKK
ncbi:MAG: hypothetical protein ACRC8A_12645 [Microcoleaceae cyanobacterium]